MAYDEAFITLFTETHFEENSHATFSSVKYEIKNIYTISINSL